MSPSCHPPVPRVTLRQSDQGCLPSSTDGTPLCRSIRPSGLPKGWDFAEQGELLPCAPDAEGPGVIGGH